MFNIFVVSLFQVIVEKAPKARIGDLDKKKYLVPSDLTGKWIKIELLTDVGAKSVHSVSNKH